MSIGTELLNAPFPEMIKTLGVSIAEAQYELDLVSMKIARLMAGYAPDPEPEDGKAPPPSSASPERTMLVPLGDGKVTACWSWVLRRRFISSLIRSLKLKFPFPCRGKLISIRLAPRSMPT